LDNDLILRQFEEIEEKVIKLIDVCKSHEATNAELEKTIERLEQKLQSKVEAEESYSKERDLVRSKVDGLLVRLNNIIES
jgi:chromosome segregation ATPase